MASFFTLTLDTTAPLNGALSIISLTGSRTITATLAADGATQMKLYGDIGGGLTEATAEWETFVTSKSITLTAGDGTKTVKVKFRDNVGNETAEITATTVLDTAAPVVTITGPDVSTVSLVDGYNVAAFSFSADTPFVAYEVRVVPSSGSDHTAGVVIGSANGSTNMAGTGEWAASAPISCTINAADLKAASDADGAKIIKVFVKDSAGNWSV